MDGFHEAAQPDIDRNVVGLRLCMVYRFLQRKFDQTIGGMWVVKMKARRQTKLRKRREYGSFMRALRSRAWIEGKTERTVYAFCLSRFRQITGIAKTIRNRDVAASRVKHERNMSINELVGKREHVLAVKTNIENCCIGVSEEVDRSFYRRRRAKDGCAELDEKAF